MSTRDPVNKKLSKYLATACLLCVLSLARSFLIIIIIIIIIQTYLCRIAASVLRKKTAINAGPVKN